MPERHRSQYIILIGPTRHTRHNRLTWPTRPTGPTWPTRPTRPIEPRPTRHCRLQLLVTCLGKTLPSMPKFCLVARACADSSLQSAPDHLEGKGNYFSWRWLQFGARGVEVPGGVGDSICGTDGSADDWATVNLAQLLLFLAREDILYRCLTFRHRI